MKDYIHAFVTILALINPAICAQMFAECTANTPVAKKGKVAVRVIFTIGFVLLLAALAGTSILNVFGISLDAFSCAGGGILVWIGVSMLKSAQESSKTQSVDNSRSPSSLTPLILFAASPGTITGVITVSSSHKHQFCPIQLFLE